MTMMLCSKWLEKKLSFLFIVPITIVSNCSSGQISLYDNGDIGCMIMVLSGFSESSTSWLQDFIYILVIGRV